MSLCYRCGRQLLSRYARPTAPFSRSLHRQVSRLQAPASQSSAPGVTFDPYNIRPTAANKSTASTTGSAFNTSSTSHTIDNHSSTSSAAGATLPPLDDETQQLRLSILNAALKLVPSHGWTDQTLHTAIRGTSLSPSILSLLQPSPVWCLVSHFLTQSTHAAFASYHALPLHTLNRQQRTTHLLHSLLSAHIPYLSRMPALLGLCFAPSLLHHSLPLLAELTDQCMHTLSDGSTTTDWYTRRAAFASVWVGGLLHRSVDRSEGGRDSERWVERRVAEWVRGEEVVGEAGVMVDLYARFGYNALLSVLAGKR